MSWPAQLLPIDASSYSIKASRSLVVEDLSDNDSFAGSTLGRAHSKLEVSVNLVFSTTWKNEFNFHVTICRLKCSLFIPVHLRSRGSKTLGDKDPARKREWGWKEPSRAKPVGRLPSGRDRQRWPSVLGHRLKTNSNRKIRCETVSLLSSSVLMRTKKKYMNIIWNDRIHLEAYRCSTWSYNSSSGNV